MPGIRLRSLVVFSIWAAATQAAPVPPLTQIQDVLYKADGTLFDGVAQIEWKGFQSANGAEIPQNSINISIVKGNLRVALVPTTDALKPARYTVRFNSGGKTQFVESWAVPSASAVLRLGEVRTYTPAVGNVTTPPVNTNIQDVTGLRTELDLRPSRGAGWRPGRAAIIGLSGAVDAIAGNASDCVRVDGTSGPCGASSGGVSSFVDSETPAGLTNGLNATFSLSAAPSPASSLLLFRNGLLQQPVSDYTISANVITTPGDRIPGVSDILQAWYRVPGSDLSVFDSETPSGTLNGLNAAFLLLVSPSPAGSLQVFRNGILQKAGVDFTLSGRTVNFESVSIPQPGDILTAAYRR